MARLRSDPPRGVLHSAGGERAERHVRYLASGDLETFVEHYWIVHWDLRGQPPRRAAVLSHPSVHLVVGGGRAEVVGVVLGRFERVLEGEGRVVGIKLRPGACFPLVGTPASAFTNRRVPLEQVFGEAGARYAADVAAEPDEQRCVELAERFLRGLSAVPDEGMRMARTIVEHAAADRTVLRVDQLVTAFGIDTRALQRLFSRYVGASPKWVIQRYRLHEALERLEDGQRPDAAALALELGYFDQAHFIKDFKALVGCSPGAYVKGAAPASRPPRISARPDRSRARTGASRRAR
jgi:AraC-like DNA-binding protein